MKYLSYTLLAALWWLTTTHYALAQQTPDAFGLGTTQEFLKQLKQKTTSYITTQGTGGQATLTVPVSAQQTLPIRINVQQATRADQLTLIGSVVGRSNSNFYLRIEGKELIGNIIDRTSGEAYVYSSDEEGQARVEQKTIDEVVCASPDGTLGLVRADQAAPAPVSAPVDQVVSLESLPGAPACIYLDFDGEYVVNTVWEEGRPINAAPSALNNAQIRETWEIVVEDFLPYQVNVTTNRAVFNQYPKNCRMQCIVTPTKTFLGNPPNVLGVAFRGSFAWNDDTPCWSFGTTPKTAGEAASHELGHTVSLSHDDVNGEGYYRGHGQWAAIMGNGGFSRPISQWSRGEYATATNQEDDLAIISSYFPYRTDDHGNNFASATDIGIGPDGKVTLRTGIIERTSDRDFFRLECGTGNVTLDITTIGKHANLETAVNLYASNGQLIEVFNGSEGRDTRLETRLDAGVYYLAVDGVGSLDPRTTGFSDYGSLGYYRITGQAPVGEGGVIVYQDCNFQGYGVTLPEGNYTLADLRARGVTNDDLSSLKVFPGYQATLYADNNFQGRAIVKTSDDACLVDDNFNDQTSAIRVARANQNSVARIEAENYNTMQGVQTEPCSEGGQNVGYIDPGDWMVYNNINFPVSGSYRVEYRVASATGGGRFSLDINAGATVLGEMDVPNTGGWQNWTTIAQTVQVNAGTYALGVYAQAPNWNLNWISITPVGNASLARTGEQTSDKIAALDQPLTEAVVLYPNPVVSQLHLALSSDAWQDSRVSIINAQGQRVWEGNFRPTLDLDRFETGIYSIVLHQSGKQLVRRFIKQ